MKWSANRSGARGIATRPSTPRTAARISTAVRRRASVFAFVIAGVHRLACRLVYPKWFKDDSNPASAGASG